MKLHTQIIGKGHPIVILHGFLGMGDNWKSISKKLADDNYEIHLPDARNHGKSPHSDNFTYELMAQDLYTYFQDHSLKKVILIGHSMGGKTAMYFASKHPEMVKKLIVVDISPRFYEPHHDDILNSLKLLQSKKLKSRTEAEQILEQKIKDKGVRLFLLKNLKRETDNTLSLKPNIDVFLKNKDEIGKELPENLAFEGSSLFLGGENSNYIAEKDTVLIAKHFSNFRIEKIQNAGHWVHAENPRIFLEKLKSFIA
jgi:pimeloyl-ACP methyl ester carboxylesterase